MFRYDPEHATGRSPRLCVVGVGGCGCRTVTHLHGLLWDALTAVINTDVQSLNAAVAVTKIRIGMRDEADAGTAGDADLGRLAAEHDIEMLRGLFTDVDVALIVTALGGGTGSGAAPVVARAAVENGATVIVLAAMPFGFESDKRRATATKALDALRERADILIRLDNEALIAASGETSAAKAFAHGIEALSDGVAALVRALAAPALLALDVGDLKRVAHDTGARIGFGTGHGAGRMAAAVAAVTESPLLDGGQALKEASFAVLCVAGGPDLAVTEIDGAVRDLAGLLPRGTDFAVGVNIDPRWRDRVVLTVLAGARARRVRSERIEHRAAPAASGETGGRRRRAKTRDLQEKLRLVDSSGRGRFKDVEATLLDNQDLDIPTFIRRQLDLEKI